jgi:hypothetical protein
VPEQELRTKIVVEGQKAAVQDITSVDEATKKLSEADAKQTTALEKKTKATDEAGASMEKYAQALESVLPGMGQFLTRGSAMVQVLGGLGKAQLSTSSVIAAGTAALGRYAGALALGGAASVFLAGAAAAAQQLHAAAAALQNAVAALAASGGGAPTVVQYGGRYNSTPAKAKTGAGHAATVEGVFEY